MSNEYTFENPEFKKTYWHTCSHIMAQAIKRLYPQAKLAIGPAIAEGWYYDVDVDIPFTPEVMEEIEAEMKKSARKNSRLSVSFCPKPKLWQKWQTSLIKSN